VAAGRPPGRHLLQWQLQFLQSVDCVTCTNLLARPRAALRFEVVRINCHTPLQCASAGVVSGRHCPPNTHTSFPLPIPNAAPYSFRLHVHHRPFSSRFKYSNHCSAACAAPPPAASICLSRGMVRAVSRVPNQNVPRRGSSSAHILCRLVTSISSCRYFP
jgi:hypothetical protein